MVALRLELHRRARGRGGDRRGRRRGAYVPPAREASGVMLTKANMHALDRLLLERFGGKVGRGLALELSRCS